MLLLDPYETSYGKTLHKDRLMKEISLYYTANAEKNLNYEYNAFNVFFILGYDKEEENLPLFNHPLIIEDYRGNKFVGCDLRKYTKTKGEQPLNIADVISDRASAINLINSTLIINDFLLDNYSKYRSVFVPTCTAYAFLISYLVNTIIALNPLEKHEVELAAMFHANVLLIPDQPAKTDDHLDIIAARMQKSKLSLPVSRKGVDQVIALCNSYDPTITALVQNIQAVLPPEKANLFNEALLINLLANMWYGHGASESLYMSLECMPMFMSLIYSALSDRTYKRSRISTLLDKYSKQINAKQFIVDMEHNLNHHSKL